MTTNTKPVFVTGANGQLGRLVLSQLVRKLPASQIVAGVRDLAKAEDIASLGVQVRLADYENPETLQKAFEGIGRLLLISSSEVGRRAPQHRQVIDAAEKAGVDQLVYTSLLHAGTSPMQLASEHKMTEAALAGSKVPSVVVRNGWYTENLLMAVPTAIELGTYYGAAGDGLISAAPRADYAAAAAAVLTSTEDLSDRVFELAGDRGFTLAEFVAEISRQTDKPIAYQNLTEGAYTAGLITAGLPENFAAILADAAKYAAENFLYDDSKQLSGLIGRPTTGLESVIENALAV